MCLYSCSIKNKNLPYTQGAVFITSYNLQDRNCFLCCSIYSLPNVPEENSYKWITNWEHCGQFHSWHSSVGLFWFQVQFKYLFLCVKLRDLWHCFQTVFVVVNLFIRNFNNRDFLVWCNSNNHTTSNWLTV